MSNRHPRKRQLSPREFQVVCMLCKGLCRKEIAASLGISVKTINTYADRIHEYFSCSNPVLLTHKLIALKVIKVIVLLMLCCCTLAAFAQPPLPAPVAVTIPPKIAYVRKVAQLRKATTPKQTPGRNKPMAKVAAKSAVKSLMLVPPVTQPGFTIAWNADPLDAGLIPTYTVLYGLTTNFSRSLNVSTNTQVTVKAPGGFTYWVAVSASVPWVYRHNITSPPCAPIQVVSAPLPPNSLQLFLEAGRWNIACQTASNAVLQTSTDLVTWTNVGTVSNSPAFFSGLQINKEFFRIIPQ